MPGDYRGRIAPSPTGYLHLGHGRTFWLAWERARLAGGVLAFRNEDLDRARCRPEFAETMREDLAWLGIGWQEGPDRGGPHAPYVQSERQGHYEAAFERLREGGFLYPCTCSRREILQAASAPHAGEEEPVYPGTCRDRPPPARGEKVHWRLRVPDARWMEFDDLRCGPQRFLAGKDFGDFVVWRQDGVPSYQLAVVVDDAAMGITEVVRGEDLLLSTARQWLLYEALGQSPPRFFHAPLMRDAEGRRLSKRHDALNLRALRAGGADPAAWHAAWREEFRAILDRGLPPN